jgi:S-methylmethionine-dependent homocysteine/selenocysteine methylase
MNENRPTSPFREDYYVTDGGMETTLIFRQGIELTHFAAFELLDHVIGRHVLVRYFRPFLDIAARYGLGYILETPTWRANSDWGFRLGYSEEELAALNADAVGLLDALRKSQPDGGAKILLSGCIGPRGDGYDGSARMTVTGARRYHTPQVRTLAEAGVDVITAMTISYSDEAIGIVQAAMAAGIPAVISFTVETDGRLPGGETLKQAIDAVDERTGGYATHFMINCAHPEHFLGALQADAEWITRIGGIRANASTKSHEELDESESLDRGDICRLAQGYRDLMKRLPALRVLGGCCGTDEEHVDEICRSLFGRIHEHDSAASPPGRPSLRLEKVRTRAGIFDG